MRVPLPQQYDELAASARLGQRIADLLDIDREEITLDATLQASRRAIAKVTRYDGMRIEPDSGDLAVTAEWASEQWREQRNSGVISRVVMPRMGRVDIRPWSDAERQALGEEELNLLGSEVVDVYLNDRVRWLCIPQAVWDFKIGGFQVLSKWLSYRDRNILGRDLTVEEVREFSSICLRLAQLVLLGPRLDTNYLTAAETG